IEYPNGFLPVNAGADDVEVNTPDDGTFDLDPHDFYRYTEDANPFLGELEYRSPQPHQWGEAQTVGRITIQEKTMLPILGLAAWQIYLTTGDRQFPSETYGSLARYDDWLWRRRNAGDGLLVWYNPEESGWDNASRLLPLPVKTVDGSTMAYLLRKMLAESAQVLGRDDDAARYADRAALTARSINAKMWDDRTGFYYDLSMDDRQRPQKSPAGFTPLMTGTVTADRVARLAAHLQNPHEFATGAPVPSLSRDDPQFDTRTWGWNGPTWIPSNWLVMESFARAGRTDLSNALMQSMAEMMTKPDGFPRTYEQYNSETGVPFGVADYSWSGAINDYLVRWVAGIQPAADQGKVVIAPHLLAGWKWFSISRVRIGQNDVGYRYDISAEKQQIRVQNTGPGPLQIDLELPVTQAPRSVMLDGQAMPASAYRIEDGELHITLPSGATRNVEVLNP
ncbi:MAG: trehalase family glycosidase, partial [Acidobacteriaceae bacterium]